MIQSQLYDAKIKNLEREIRLLKTSHVKTATTISTISKHVNVDFSLVLEETIGGADMYSSKRAIITLTAIDGSDMVSACYLDGLDAAMMESWRFVEILRVTSQPGQIKYCVDVMSQSSDDYWTLSSGGSVDLSYGLTLVGSSNFNVSVAYRDFFEGSS